MTASVASTPRRIAVVLFNLGGPAGRDDVRPFLQNLFSDPAIINLPAPVRLPLAALIAARRAPIAQKSYDEMGGGSPLLAETEAQARALEARLNTEESAAAFKTFIAMRYWRPFVKDAAAAIRAWRADVIVLLPLYPQFSTTTTGSSLQAWRRAARDLPPAHVVCCYPEAASFLDAHAQRIREVWSTAGAPRPVRLLFSAHGLPERVIRAGDPYQDQVEATAAAAAARVPEFADWRVCYQSRVGPLKWIGPATEDEIIRAAREGLTVLVSPIAFVSEHVETLVELDIEYAARAREHGAPGYLRAPALGVAEAYIEALAAMTRRALASPAGAAPGCDGRRCAPSHGRCPARSLAP